MSGMPGILGRLPNGKFLSISIEGMGRDESLELVGIGGIFGRNCGGNRGG